MLRLYQVLIIPGADIRYDKNIKKTEGELSND